VVVKLVLLSNNIVPRVGYEINFNILRFDTKTIIWQFIDGFG